MKRAWYLIVSVVVGGTAGWATYFAWGYRNYVGGKELLWGGVGAVAGLIVYGVTARR